MGENCPVTLPKFRLPHKFRDLLHAANLRHGTDGFTSPPKEGVMRIFFAPKNPMVSVGFEPANLGTKGHHATPRPPKPLYIYIPNILKCLQIITAAAGTKLSENKLHCQIQKWCCGNCEENGGTLACQRES